MKKFLAKLALFSTISLTATYFLNTSITFAQDEEPETVMGSGTEEELANYDTSALSHALEDVAEKPCLRNAKESEPDYEYIVTILEEPLTLEEEGSTPGDEYVTRICYRNYFSFKGSDGKVKPLSILSTECSQDIQEFSSRFGSIQQTYNIKYACDPVQIILSKGGTSLIYGYIGSIYKWGASMAGIIAVLVIIISGMQISIAGGEPQAIENAKKRIIKSIAGIVILFLSGLILYTINPTFFVR